MENRMKGHKHGDGKAGRGMVRFLAKLGRGVLYTYAVLIVWVTNVVYVAVAIPEAHAGDGVATATAIIGEVTVSPYQAILADAGPASVGIESNPLPSGEAIGGDGATVASADCLARYRWQPGARAQKCGASKAESQVVAMAGTDGNPLPAGEVTGGDGVTAASADCLARYRWQPGMRAQKCGASKTASAVAAMAETDGNTLPVGEVTGGGATVASADCLARYRWQPGLRAQKCGASKTESTVVAMAANEVGSTTVVVNKVTGVMKGDLRRLTRGGDVLQNEVIETAASSASEIVFRDDTKVMLGPDSSLKLDEFVFNPDPSQSKFVMSSTKGMFRFKTGNLDKDSYVINAPGVTIGVRGTVFSSVIGDKGETVLILDCPKYFPWQPQLRAQWEKEHAAGKGITVTTADDELYLLDGCGMSLTVYPDGMVVSGLPPDWAIERLEFFDELVGQPEPDPGDRNNHGDDDDDNGNGNNNNSSGSSSSGLGGNNNNNNNNNNSNGSNNNRSGQDDGPNPSGQFGPNGPLGNNNGGNNNPGGQT